MTTDPRPAAAEVPPLGVVVLAGGEGRRLGGSGKPGLTIAGRTLLDHVLLACPPDAPVVAVGPVRPTVRPVAWTREDPPGGGPVAGLVAGLRLVEAPLVLLLAADLPRLGPAVSLVVTGAEAAVAAGRDGAWAVDADGVGQPLVCCVATRRLQAVLPAEPRGLPLRQVVAGLRLDAVTVPAGSVADVDTPQQLARMRQDPAEAAGTAGATRSGRDEEA